MGGRTAAVLLGLINSKPTVTTFTAGSYYRRWDKHNGRCSVGVLVHRITPHEPLILRTAICYSQACDSELWQRLPRAIWILSRVPNTVNIHLRLTSTAYGAIFCVSCTILSVFPSPFYAHRRGAISLAIPAPRRYVRAHTISCLPGLLAVSPVTSF